MEVKHDVSNPLADLIRRFAMEEPAEPLLRDPQWQLRNLQRDQDRGRAAAAAVSLRAEQRATLPAPAALLRDGYGPSAHGAAQGRVHRARLHFIEATVKRVRLHQLAVRALFRNLPLIQDNDPVRQADRGKAVCDNESRAAFDELLEGG